MHLRCRGSSNVSSNTLPDMCSKPWLLFHKPGLLFPLESLDVFLILKQACFLFWRRRELSHTINTPHIFAPDYTEFNDTSALMASQKWHVCCSNNHSFMSINPSVNAGSVASITGLTCLRTGAHIRHLYWVARLQVEDSAHHHPLPPFFWLCQILVCSQTAEWQPFTKPRFYGNIYLPSQADRRPSQPTHSFSGLNTRDHQHSHRSISSQGPRVSDLCQSL